MPLVRVLLAYQKEFDKGKAVTGNVQVQGNAFAVCEEKVADHFNIPIYTAAGASQIEVPGYTYKSFNGLDDTTGKDIVVPGYSKTANAANPRKRPHSVRLPTKILKVAGNEGKGYRTCSIRFPWFFTIPMIGQALGTMLKANQPTIWISKNGKSYPWFAMQPGIATGAKVGAWHIAEPIAPVNTDATPLVGDNASPPATGGKKG